MADFDGDGRPDLISGSNCCDPLGFHVFLRKADGTFAPGKRFEAAFADPKAQQVFLTPLDRGHSRVFVTDWNRDGKPDLLLSWYWFSRLFVALGPLDTAREQIGGFKAVAFDPGAGLHSSPVVADWDRDGSPDLVVGLSGEKPGVYWFRNLADKGEPRFAPGVRLVPTPKGEQLMEIAVADWDGTGWPALMTSWLLRAKKDGVYQDTSRVELYRRDVRKR